MPQADIPSDEAQSGEHCSLTSSAGTVASHPWSSNGSRPSSGMNWQPLSMAHLNNMVMPSTHSRPLQRQMNLIDALRHSVGTNDMATMTQIQLLLSSSMFGLHRLNVFLPSLTALNLDGSSLESLRDLGSELNLKYLNVSRCGLRTLDGINGMQTLEHLVADNNQIESVLLLTNLTEMQILSLKGNLIKIPEALSCLILCAHLVELSVSDNPIANRVDYRRCVSLFVPNLMILDGMSVEHHQRRSADKISSSEFSSSLSSSLSRGIETHELSAHAICPLSSIGERNSETVLNIRNRPSTAEPFSDSNGSLCHGDAIVGNIIDKVRRERRHLSKMNAAESRPSTCSPRTISSGNSADTSSGHQFPNVLPQSIVELELGIVEIQNPAPSVLEISSVSANDTNSSELLLHSGYEATAKLLAAARKWRETSQRSRSTGVHDTK